MSSFGPLLVLLRRGKDRGVAFTFTLSFSLVTTFLPIEW